MPALLDILKDPNYINANEATKRAIFERWAPQDTNYTGANEATQAAIQQRFGLGGFFPVAQPPEEPQSFFRQVADVPLGVAKGAVQGVRMIADAFGAGSDTSQTIKGAEEYLGGLMSAAAKKDQQEISRLMKDAEDKGVLDQVKAGFQAFATAPVDLLTQAFGTAVPVILGTVGAKLLGAGAGIATGVSALTGAGMGAGVVKGSIYEETKRALIEAGAQPEEAERRAQLAQEYGGKNLDQILLGTALGGVAAVGPLEKGAAGALARRILGKVGGEEVAETTVEQAAKGALRRRAEAAGLEAVPEALQAGQERVAQNIALQREGFEDVPTFRGAAGAATLEGLAGAGLGAMVGRPQAAPEVEPPAPEAPPIEPTRALEFRPEPYIQFPDGTVAKQSEVEAYIKTLPEDQQMEMRTKLLGLEPQSGTEFSPQEIAELEKQQAKAKRKPTAEELIAKARIKTGKPTTERDVTRIRDEYETAVIEGLLAQDAEMQRANELANIQREEFAPQVEAEPDVLSPAIAEVDQRVREGRIMARVQDLIDRNIPFASTAITDINDKLSVINEAPLNNEERNRIQNIMGMVNVFTGFVNLPQLAPRPVDTTADNREMEALIKERKERGPTEPLRATPVAPSPRVEEAPVSQRVDEGAALRPEGGVEPSVAEDRELVIAPPVEPVPVVEAAAPVAEAPAAPPAPESDQQALEEKRQMVADMIETKKANREAVPEAWIKRLADLSAQLRGETISDGETYSMEVAGHPLFDGPPVLRNLIPIKVKDSDAAQRALDRALDLEKQFATEFYGANQALKSARTAAEKKSAQTRIKKLNDQGWDEDALKTLRNETIQELSRLVDVTQKSAPKAEEPAVETPAAPAKPARVAKPRKATGSIMGSPMLAGIFNQLGGLHTSLLSEFSTRFFTKILDKNGRPIIRFRNPLIPGRGALFNKNGKVDFTEIAEHLEQEGYLEPGSVERDYKEAGERAKDLIKRALNKEEVLTIQEQIDKDSREAQEAARQAQLDREEENRMIAAGEMELEPEFDWTDEEFRENLGFDKQFEEDLDVYNLEPEDLRFLTDEELESELTDAEREQAQARRTGKAEEDARRKAAESPAPREDETFLTAQSEEELRERDKAIRQKEYEEKLKEAKERTAERKEREQRDVKARALETVDDFELGRTAEEQMSGMRDMFEEPTKPARVGTDEQTKSADEHAASIGGTVVYQDGDIALARGYSILTGDPVYSVINGNYRSKIDVRSYTGNLVTPEQKAELVKIRDDLEAKDKEAFDRKPSVKFDDGLAFSKDIPKEIKGIVQGWRELLGLKGNLYVTTVDDARANRDNFNGPHRAISSAGLSDNEAGSFRMLSNGDYYIAFRPSTSKTRMLEVIAHELGHMHEREVFKNADADTQQKIRDEHSKWLKSQTGQTAEQLIKSLRAKTTGKTTRIEKGLMANELSPYWKSFGEWYADQVSKWATTSEKPVSVVEKFFSRLGKALRNFYNKLINQGYLPNETFVQYLEKAHQFPARFGPSEPKGPQAVREEAKSQERATANFLRWFGDSKVVDENGEPMVMYHGTTRGGFSVFDRLKSLGWRGPSMDTVGSWFSNNPSDTGGAGLYAKAGGDSDTIYPVYLSIKNPKKYRTFSEFLRHMHRAAGRPMPESAPGRGSTEELRNELISEGYDGIEFEQTDNTGLMNDIKQMQDAVERAKQEEFSVKRADRLPYTQKRERLEQTLKSMRKELDEFGSSTEFDEQRVFIAFEPTQIKSAIGNNGEYSLTDPDIGKSISVVRAKAAKAREDIIEAGREAGQKRKLDKGAFEGVDEDLFEKLKPVFAPRNRTIQDRIIDMRDNFWQRVAQGMADQFRTIKDYSYDAYMKARLSKSIDGGLEGLMFYGQVFNDGGALNIKKNTRGMFDVLKPVGKELDRYLIYIALSRDAALPDSKRSIDPDLVARRGELIAGTLNGKPRKEVYEQVRKDMNVLNRSVLKVAVDAGLLNTTAGAIKDIENNESLTDEQKREKIEELRKNPIGYERFINDLNYIPFYKIMEDGDTDSVARAVSASGLTSQYFSKALKGGEKPFGDLMENTLKNWSHILSASMKNQAAVAAMDAAVKAGAAVPNLKPQYDFVGGQVVFRKNGEVVGDGSIRADMTEQEKGAVKIVVDGKNTYYNVSDPLLMDSITSIGFLGTQSKFLDVARDFKNLLQYGVTISPQFRVNNLIRDAVGAMGVSELRLNPIANVMQGVSLSDRNSPTYIAAMSGGGIFNFGTAYEGDQSKMIKRLLKMGVDRDHILDSDSKIKNGLRYAWDKYQEWGNKAENANRLALYQQLRDKGMSHLEATFKARDLMDFSMQGSWPAFRVLTQVIPFLNARVQGLYKLGRDGISPTARVIRNTVTGEVSDASDKQKAQQFSIVLMGVTLASALLYLTFKDDEEYKRRDDWDKDNFWWFRVPGMEFALRVPKPFEIGAFGTVVERTLEQILDSGAEGKEFGDALWRMLTSTFAINPIPQVIKPLVDIYANKDSFTGAPIESAGLERLSKQERMVDTTSPMAIALGKVSTLFPETFELSPVQADYLIKGYLGWLGGTIAMTSTYATMPFREGEYPDARWLDRASLGLARELPGRGAKFVTAFYESNKEIAQAYADMRHYAAIGDSQKVQELLEEKGDKIRLAKFYDNVATQMANIRKQIRLTQNDKLMDGAAKKEAIDRMQDMIAMLAKQAEDIRKQQKK